MCWSRLVPLGMMARTRVRSASVRCRAQADGGTVQSAVGGAQQTGHWVRCAVRLRSVEPQQKVIGTDHIYIDMKLTDIGWPTKIVLPSVCDDKY